MCLMVLIHALQCYFECIIKKHETFANVSPVLIYVNEINNRIVFKIESGYKLELLSKETMKLLGSTSNSIDKDKNSELVPKLESVDLALVHCNVVNNSYQQESKVLFTFAPNRKYGQLITVSPHSLIMLKTVNTEFSFIEIWFTDQDNRMYKMRHSLEPEYRKYVKGYGFLSFARNFGDKYGKSIINSKNVKKLMDRATKASKDFAKIPGKKNNS